MNISELKKNKALIVKQIKAMNPKHYKLQSEYHRLMYGYTLTLETINGLLNLAKK